MRETWPDWLRAEDTYPTMINVRRWNRKTSTGWSSVWLTTSFLVAAPRASVEALPRPEDVRSVPIPPVLVMILHEHINAFGMARDGRLFFGIKTGERYIEESGTDPERLFNDRLEVFDTAVGLDLGLAR